jgi:hypothetical protein
MRYFYHDQYMARQIRSDDATDLSSLGEGLLSNVLFVPVMIDMIDDS